MSKRTSSVARQGRIYRFTVGETTYAAFVWQAGQRFVGRVEGHSQVPEVTGRTALAVRDALQNWLAKGNLV
jgi:hypothetical protein